MIERSLTPDERAGLANRLTRARRESRVALAKTALSSLFVCGVLAVLTRLASDAPTSVIVAFWALLAVVFTLWIGLPWHRTMRQQVASLGDALQAGRARVTHVQSPAVVEFEEEEDEGACYAFAWGTDASLFIVGQEVYEDVDFPNSDFSIIDVLGTHGRPVDTLIVKFGTKLTPLHVVSAKAKRLVEIPDHLTIVNKPVDRVESALPQAH